MEIKQLLGNCSLLPVKLTQHPELRDIRPKDWIKSLFWEVVESKTYPTMA